MKEYIERELLLIGVDGCISALHVQAKGDLVQESAIKLVEATRGYIASLSAADVVEVRHGRWIGSEMNFGYCDIVQKECIAKKYICSECGYETGDQAKKFVCCPICMARMDKEDEM